MAEVSDRNGVPDRSSQRRAAANAVANPSPHARSSPRWWASSAITSVRSRTWPAQRLPADAIFAYVTAIPWKSRGGRTSSASGTSCTPIAAAASAHCRVSGAVGQATTTRSIALAASIRRATSIEGRVLPAPGAAEIR